MSYKEQILKLKLEGKTNSDIAKIVGCNRSTVVYYTTEKGQQNRKKINNKYRNRVGWYKEHPFDMKMQFFKKRKKLENIKKSTSNIDKIIYRKLYNFFYNGIQTMTNKYKLEDVINKFGEKPKCYLTGIEIDINKPNTYQFDHIIPVSRGGDNSLENMGICLAEINRAKYNMTDIEFIEMCKKVANYNK